MKRAEETAARTRIEEHPDLGEVRIVQLKQQARRGKSSTDFERDEARRLVKQGRSTAEVAKLLGRSARSIQTWLKEGDDDGDDHLGESGPFETATALYRYRVVVAMSLHRQGWSATEIATVLSRRRVIEAEEVDFYLTQSVSTLRSLSRYGLLMSEARARMLSEHSALEDLILQIRTWQQNPGLRDDIKAAADVVCEPADMGDYWIVDGAEPRRLSEKSEQDRREFELAEAQRTQEVRRYHALWRQLPAQLSSLHREAENHRSRGAQLAAQADKVLDGLSAAQDSDQSVGLHEALETASTEAWLDIDAWISGLRRMIEGLETLQRRLSSEPGGLGYFDPVIHRTSATAASNPMAVTQTGHRQSGKGGGGRGRHPRDGGAVEFLRGETGHRWVVKP